MLKFKLLIATMLIAGAVNSYASEGTKVKQENYDCSVFLNAQALENNQPAQLLQPGQPTLGDMLQSQITTAYQSTSSNAQASTAFAQSIPTVIGHIHSLTRERSVNTTALAHRAHKLQVRALQRAHSMVTPRRYTTRAKRLLFQNND